MAPPMTYTALQARDSRGHGVGSDPLLVEGWTLYALGVCVILTRLITRYKMVGVEGSKPDDWLMIFVMIIYGIESTMSHLVSLYGGNSNLSPIQREEMSEEEVQRRVFGSKMFMVGWFTYSGAMWVLKLCMVFFFARITVGLRRQIWITGAYVVVGISYFIICLVLFLTCRPWHKLWQIYPDPGPNCSIESPVYYLTVLSFNVATDAFLISLPLPLLIRSSLPWRRKAILILLFSAGIFVITAAVLRCVFSLTDPQNSRTVSAWACRETFVAVVVGNAPMLKPLFSGHPWRKPATQPGNSKLHSSLDQKKRSNSGDATLVNESMEKLEIYQMTELSVETEKRATWEDDRPLGIDGLGVVRGCSYAATCEFSTTSSRASSSHTASGETCEV
ncbi:hypothetical protein L873DRAFT_265629 [Choiromyces venosus 120613-1]|uniref:Rhodopsin domain-containing protein n=1 Tax=Choiromyces venosus 120613-1 TaxID=1336337 RepID=A0A3N4J127_9PEZI|nr:hypothetical protein L873DRAFT_265629 [Choiromyces venosus 120613-1]